MAAVIFQRILSFDALQRLLIKSLSRHCQISIGLMYEPKRPEIFAAVERSFGYLSGFARLHDLHMEGSVRKPDLQHLTAKLGAGSYQTLAVADSINFIESGDSEGELRAVLRSIKAKLQHGAAYNDFWLLYVILRLTAVSELFVMNMVYLLLYLRSLL